MLSWQPSFNVVQKIRHCVHKKLDLFKIMPYCSNIMENVQSKKLAHLSEILRIVEGAVNADRQKVIAYTEQLASKIEADGDPQAAERLRGVLQKSKFQDVTAAKFSPKLPVDSESRLSLADEAFFEEHEAKLFLSPVAQSHTDEFIRFVQSAASLDRHGVGITPSLLMYGPPGCGKTELSHYISSKLHLPLITARADALVSSFLGSTAKNLRLLFEHAMARPCVLFLDEFDSIAKLRDDKHELGELKRVVVSLLQNIDALNNKTVLLAATNHEHLLDPAVWRRFGFKLHIEKPAELARRQMVEAFLAEFATPESLKLSVALSEELTGADIKQVCEDSKRSAILGGHKKVCSKDLAKRFLSLRLSQMDNLIAIKDKVKAARQLNKKVMTYRLLRDLFGISVGQISYLLGEEENES